MVFLRNDLTLRQLISLEVLEPYSKQKFDYKIFLKEHVVLYNFKGEKSYG